MEYRSYKTEFRSDENQPRVICGYGSVFNSPSEDMGFIETIAPTAITDDTIKHSDVIATYNHDENTLLARSRYGEGTLSLSVDDNGLYYQFEVPNTTLGNDTYELLKRGDLGSSSFAFTIADEPNAQVWEERDGQIYRTINKIDRIYDISIVNSPAYPAATSACRNKPEDYKEFIDNAKMAADELRKQEINQKLDAKLANFYKNINL